MGVIPIASKLLASVTLHRLYTMLEEQAGFRAVNLPSDSFDSDLVQPQNAIDVTYTFSGPTAFHILRFIPAALWKQSDSCSNRSIDAPKSRPNRASGPTVDALWSTSPEQLITNRTLIRSLRLANVSNLCNRSEEQILPLALWADRSALVFVIRHLSLRNKYGPSRHRGRVRICAIPWDLAAKANQETARMEVLCNTPLKEVSHSGCQSNYQPLCQEIHTDSEVGVGPQIRFLVPAETVKVYTTNEFHQGQNSCPVVFLYHREFPHQ
ncbi:unnamed protein product [Echinostoma caproni]|uniref:Uncharacterized protein n=1 Tax=Echinostoma caproni TaxID=27848 RepID=A0A183BGA3_9TREM|nr:unnamed protein product [Echinostoma caproni]